MTNKISIYQGDNTTVTWAFSSNGSPVDISDWNCFLTVKRNINDSDTDAIISASVGSGEHSDPTSGSLYFTLGSDETYIMPNTYVYDIQTIDETGSITTVVYDTFNVQKGVTIRQV